MLQHHTTSVRATAAEAVNTVIEAAVRGAQLWDSLTENEHLMLCYLEERDWPVELCVKVRPYREMVIQGE